MILNFVRRNNIYFIYLFTLICLLLGLIKDSGFKHVHYLAIYSFAFAVFSFLLHKPLQNFISRLNFDNISHLNTDKLALYFSVLTVVSIVVHFFVMMQVPLFEAWKTTDDVKIAKIRNQITVITPPLFNYISSFVLKGLLPFFIFYFYKTGNKRLFWLLSIAGGFYALALIQKSYIVLIFLPLWVYLFSIKRYLNFSILSSFFVLSIAFLVITANPFLIGRGVGGTERPENTEIEEGKTDDPGYIYQKDPFAVEEDENDKAPDNAFLSAYYIAGGVTERLLLTPGKIISKWFEYIPSKYSYTKGCGYHFAAPFLGCEFIDFSAILYDELYPNYAAKGLHGTVVAASFMYDFANFGVYGLVLSALILSTLFSFVNKLFYDEWLIGFSLNFYFIIILQSSAISTLLFSGGWGLILLLYLLFKRRLTTIS